LELAVALGVLDALEPELVELDELLQAATASTASAPRV
jgi:predicted outer membrane lipoprotein